MSTYKLTFSNSGDDLRVAFEPASEESYLYSQVESGEKVLELGELEEVQQLQLMKGLGLFFPQFEDSDPILSKVLLPRVFGKGEAQFHVGQCGFFPGTFNPWHEGHLECLKRSGLSDVIVIPDFNPWKDTEDEDKNYWEEFKALAQELSETPYPLYSGFWGEKTKNPTSSWLPYTKVDERFLVMGADTYMDLLYWKNPTEILSNLKGLRVLGRKVHEKEMLEQKEALLEINSELDIQIEILNPHEDLSSTKLREEN